jgi:hypothetical protein
MERSSKSTDFGGIWDISKLTKSSFSAEGGGKNYL